MDERPDWYLAALVVVAIVAAAPCAKAQVVNTEQLTEHTYEAGFSGGLNGSFSLQSGNVDLIDVGGGAHFQYQTVHPDPDPEDSTPAFVRNRYLLRASARYASRSDEAYLSRSFAHARWTSMWLRRLGSEIFAQHQFNEFQRLQTRLLGGVGARVEPVHQKSVRVSAGSGYMLEYERIAPEVATEDDPETLAHRWTNFVSAGLALFEDRLLLQNTVYFQPRFDEFTDFRVLEQFELAVRVTEVLSLGSSLSVSHDSEPPTNVEPTDITLQQTVNLDF
jgi:hypothetical protein